MLALPRQPPRWLTRWLAFARDVWQTERPATQQHGQSVETIDRSRAFEEFFFRFERKIFGSLWRITGDEQAAHDLSQETFLRAWQHFDEIRDRDSGAWLFRVAANAAFTYLRRRSQRATLPLDEEQLNTRDLTAGVIEQDIVMRTLQSLTPKQRTVLVLHEVYGLTSVEIGQMLRLSQTAIRMALWRAREQFRIHYLQEEDA
jgi:RNA polymerase sigma-70 factor, ECF subfamily